MSVYDKPSSGTNPDFLKTQAEEAAKAWEAIADKKGRDTWVGQDAAKKADACREAARRLGEQILALYLDELMMMGC